MPRLKPIHKGLKMPSVDFDQQITPGTLNRHVFQGARGGSELVDQLVVDRGFPASVLHDATRQQV
ncbi:hypothetical protein [Alkalilimnicola sp. S0819]|uniref:hypothetical protein n=1 Tax=Alkalilimnicola sp. S0819 TaxID=2613922 RepID=UPI0012620912|nr:hypothetical protein [Alkalilimnicola sp. S0819]KAB7627147.1 hypothetical protein F3N43_04330 [Alkalilimnicola sp. S0819]MPQ15856.1 hypothetical protein [Alkalilimnicola sp. S0819]